LKKKVVKPTNRSRSPSRMTERKATAKTEADSLRE
jgi:hypothetical protein